MEAQRYPDDYDGIIAGSPVYRVLQLRSRHVWTWQCNHEDPTGAHAIPVGKLPAIFKAVVAACDHLDGIVDGRSDDPRALQVPPQEFALHRCRQPDVSHRAQVETLQCMYAGPPVNLATGEQVYQGCRRRANSIRDNRSETCQIHNTPRSFRIRSSKIPTMTSRPSLSDGDVESTLNKEFEGETLEFIHNADNPDLTAFKRRGGKMIVWHGESDPLPNPVDTIDYYNRIRNQSRS